MGVPCTSLGVVDQVVTVGSGYRVSPGRSTALGDRCPWEQVFHLAFGEAEMDKESPDLSHRADRDSHFLTAPHVSLPEEHVGYMVTAGVHDQPPDLPYLAVGRTDGQAAAYVYVVPWDGVDDDLLRGFGSARRAADVHKRVPSQPVHLVSGVVSVPSGVEVR